MKYSEEDYIQINHIQHYTFCKRQWALIYLDETWEENYHTSLGKIVHEKVDMPTYKEKRKDIFIERAVPVISHEYGIYGILDAVEFQAEHKGIIPQNERGPSQYFPMVIEYKKGKPKTDDSDLMQLVAQVVCLEEMFDRQIDVANFYYKSIHRRVSVDITEEKREKLRSILDEMRLWIQENRIPQVEANKKCRPCSLEEKCMPTVQKKADKGYGYIFHRTGVSCEKT